MTDDVNAAIEGAFEAGATEVVVNDSHWTMTNILLERLDPRADLIKGFHKRLCMSRGSRPGWTPSSLLATMRWLATRTA